LFRSARRLPGTSVDPSAILGRGGIVAAEFHLRLLRAAGIPAERAPHHANRLAARQSARLADPAAALPAGVLAGRRALPAGARAVRAQFDLRAVHRLPLRLGAAD